MISKSRTSKTTSPYLKIANIPGFKYLVNLARERLGLTITPLERASEDHAWISQYSQAALTIVDIFHLSAKDQAFVMNAVALGWDEALKTKESARITILIPEVPLGIAIELEAEIAPRLWPKSGEGTWLQAVEDGEPAGVHHLWTIPSGKRPAPRATVVRGPGVVALMIRNGPRIYMDVTDANREDIKKALPEIAKLRKELRTRNPTLRRGAPASKDEGRAVEAARLHRENVSLVDIGRRFGWRVYTDDIPAGSCPTAVKYISLGEEILAKVELLEKKLGQAASRRET